MAKKEIRTKYIKSLVADKDEMAKILEESTKESLSSLLDESVNRNLRQMLAESDNDSYEEEVTTEQPDFNSEPEMNQDGGDAPAEGDGDINLDLGSGEEGAEGCENGECADGAEGDDVWAGLEDCMDSDGEYDLRGKDIASVIEILQTIEKMAPETDVRIIKNSDDTVEIEGGKEGAGEGMTDGADENNAEPNGLENEMGSEGAIDGGDGMDNADADGDNDTIDLNSLQDGQGDDETVFELQLGDDNDETNADDMVNEGNVNLGYTDNYQNKSAMTMPTDKGDGEGDSRFDGGATKGGENNKKRWVGEKGKNNGNPYSDKTKQQPVTEGAEECQEECNENIFEVELEETHTRGMARKHNSVGRTEVPDTNVQADEEDTRNVFVGAEQKRNCSKNESRMAEINRQANAILAENKELKNIAAQMKQQLNEAVLINASLAKVIRLITENATSRDEKINILNRFNKVTSLNECKNLYSQISGELKSAHSVNNSNLLNKQLTEVKGQNKNMVVETNMLNQSEDLKQIIDLNERLMRLGK